MTSQHSNTKNSALGLDEIHVHGSGIMRDPKMSKLGIFPHPEEGKKVCFQSVQKVRLNVRSNKRNGERNPKSQLTTLEHCTKIAPILLIFFRFSDNYLCVFCSPFFGPKKSIFLKPCGDFSHGTDFSDLGYKS